MNYIKIVEGVTGLFPKKAKVKLVFASNNQLIGNYNVWEEKLPVVFDKPVLLEIDGAVWRIVSVAEKRQSSYWLSRKMEIFVEKPENYQPVNRYLIPTIPYNNLETKEGSSLTGNALQLPMEGYRQMEFLPQNLLENIQEEMNSIEKIIHPEITYNALSGYLECYHRSSVFDRALAIPYKDLLSTLPIEREGIIIIDDRKKVINGFSIITTWHKFYGIVIDGIVRELSVEGFECLDDEFISLISSFNLVLADWCNAKLIMQDTRQIGDEDFLYSDNTGLPETVK